MDKKTILAIVLSILVLFVYQTFFVKPPPKKPVAIQKETSTAAPTAGKEKGTAPEQISPVKTTLSPQMAVK